MNENQNQFPNTPEQLNDFTSSSSNIESISALGVPNGPEVRATEVTYITKDQLVRMINEHTGSSISNLGAGIFSVGVGLAANAIKAKVPPVIAGLLVTAGSLIAVGQLIQQIGGYTTVNEMQQILLTLVNNPKVYTRIKVTVTTWQELRVLPTMSYWTYYTTTSYQAV